MSYFTTKVPWKNKDKVRMVINDPLLIDDWNVATGKVFALLHRVVVDHI